MKQRRSGLPGRAGLLAGGDGGPEAFCHGDRGGSDAVRPRPPLRGSTAAAALMLCVLAACRVESDTSSPDAIVALRTATLPAEHAEGEELYNASCSACHGRLGLGTRRGPPLVNPVYAPGHHADAAFHLAVQQGVRAHHFRFGNMPPVPGLSRADVDEIVGYVRWLQRTAGIE